MPLWMRKCQIRTHAALRRGSQTFFIAGDSLGGISVFFRNGLYLIYPYLSVFILHLYMEVDGLKYEANWSDSRVTVSAAHFGTRHHARQSGVLQKTQEVSRGWSVLRPDLDVQYFVIITILRCTSIYIHNMSFGVRIFQYQCHRLQQNPTKVSMLLWIPVARVTSSGTAASALLQQPCLWFSFPHLKLISSAPWYILSNEAKCESLWIKGLLFYVVLKL